MTEMGLEIRNAEALRSAHDRWLSPPAESEPCETCGGTGYVPGTDSEHLFGDLCPKGCEQHPEMMKRWIEKH